LNRSKALKTETLTVAPQVEHSYSSPVDEVSNRKLEFLERQKEPYYSETNADEVGL